MVDDSLKYLVWWTRRSKSRCPSSSLPVTHFVVEVGFIIISYLQVLTPYHELDFTFNSVRNSARPPQTPSGCFGTTALFFPSLTTGGPGQNKQQQLQWVRWKWEWMMVNSMKMSHLLHLLQPLAAGLNIEIVASVTGHSPLDSPIRFGARQLAVSSSQRSSNQLTWVHKSKISPIVLFSRASWSSFVLKLGSLLELPNNSALAKLQKLLSWRNRTSSSWW